MSNQQIITNDVDKLDDSDKKSENVYASLLKNKRPKKKKKSKLPLVVVVIIVIGALGVGGFLYKNHSDKKHISRPTNSSAISTVSATANSGKTQYSANGSDLNLSFSYPKDWSASPKSGTDTTDATITVTSPIETIPSANGTSVAGRVVFSIRSGNDSVNELNSNSPVVAQNSTQIAYAAPTANQYQYPYMTFISYGTVSSNTTEFEEVIVSGSTSLAQGTTLISEDMSGLDPIISATFYKCSSETCASSVSSLLPINSTIWQNTPIFQQVLATIQSLKLN